METSAASVSRTGSFRKRALEERESLDMDVDLLPSKHERYVHECTKTPCFRGAAGI